MANELVNHDYVMKAPEKPRRVTCWSFFEEFWVGKQMQVLREMANAEKIYSYKLSSWEYKDLLEQCFLIL